MRRFGYLIMVTCLLCSRTATADFVNPATLEIKEIHPGQFTVVLTLPTSEGRVLKAEPLLPDIFVVQGNLTERTRAGSVIRTWTMACNPKDLVGASIGVEGLLGGSQEIVLTIETLDGRKYVQPLRSTQSFYVIPPPPTFTQLARDAGRKGMELVLRRPELALLLLLSVFLLLRHQDFAAAIVAFATAQALGQWLAGQNLMAVSPFIPRTLTALTALLAAFGIMRGQPGRPPGWHHPLWPAMLLLGVMYGAAQPETVATMGLSRGAHYIAFAFVALGAVAGLTLLTLCVRELRAALAGLSEAVQGRLAFWIVYLSGVLACALFLYEASTPAFIGDITPAVPVVTLVTAAVFGLWLRGQSGHRGNTLSTMAGILFAAGVILSFSGAMLPLTTLAVFSLLALSGVALVFSTRWPLWIMCVVVAAATVYHGYNTGQYLRDSTSLPVAHTVGMGALVAFLFYACYRVVPGKTPGMDALWIRAYGALAVAVAVLWRLAEYRDWFSTQVAVEMAMGVVRLPVLAAVLLLVAGLAWPRKRRFKAQLEGGAPVAHWVLLAVAFFTFPLGTWRVHNPFYTPRAPTAIEATRIMDTLLSDTYLAFNLPDEEAAFDRLADNLSQDLVADVYLDSRRRLTAGTRQAAEVTVKDVNVMSMDAATPGGGSKPLFTYPCKWIVTARVKHLQHIHNRQNIYTGEVTIGVENDRWKIADIDLKSEERVVMLWQSS